MIDQQAHSHSQFNVMGSPIKNSFILHCLKGKEEGRDVLYFSVTGEPSTFVVYDVNEKKILRSFPHGCDLKEDLGTKACWTHTMDHEGNVYMAPFGSKSGYLFQYNIQTKKLVTIGPVMNEVALYHLSCDEEGNVYGGTYPNGKIFQYNRRENRIIDCGSVLPDNNYVISCAYHQGGMYGGTRGSDPKFFYYSLKDRTTKIIPPPDFIKGKINAFYYMTKVGDLLFPVIKMEDETYYVTCYDIAKQSFTPLCEKGLGGQHVSSPLHNKVYFISEDGWFKTIDLDTFKVENTGILYYSFHEGDDGFDYANGLMGGGFFTLKDQETYPGLTYLTTNYDKNKVGYINLEKKTVEFPNLENFVENPIQIKAIGNTPQGDIVFGGYMGSKVGIYRLDEQSYEYFTCRQTEGITTCGDKVYFGVYTRAAIWEYDPLKPYIEFENPKPIFTVGEHQDRPFALCDAGGKLAIGTIPNYGMLGGALTIYDPNTGIKKVFRNLIPDQSITSVCYHQGIIYCSTGIWGGLGGIPSTKEAEVFAFSMEEERIVKRTTLRFPFASDPLLHIGGLSMGADGLLWGISSGVVFTLDPTTLALQDVINIYGVNWKIEKVNWKSANLIFIGDHLYCNPDNKLAKVNLVTKEYEAYNEPAFMMTVGKDNNIYYCDADLLYRWDISEEV